jgi:MoxR-like ATPase
LDGELATSHDLCRRLVAAVATVVRGKDEVIELALATLLAQGHVLFEDVPGVAKTLLAKTFAASLGLDFARVQFTPDLLPSDIIGLSVFDRASGTQEFRPGPVFTNVLLADELNRASPKTQAALLEAMAEGQVTIDGTTHPLPRPFLVLATQNPIEFEGTYPLPEAQVDRFLASASIGYPSAATEAEVVAAHLEGERFTLHPLASRHALASAQAALGQVYVAPAVVGYIVELVRFTRARASVALGASPRGSIALALLARARALIDGRDFVVPDDVKRMAVPALSHRVRMAPEAWIRKITPAHVIREALDAVPAPVATARPVE